MRQTLFASLSIILLLLQVGCSSTPAQPEEVAPVVTAPATDAAKTSAGKADEAGSTSTSKSAAAVDNGGKTTSSTAQKTIPLPKVDSTATDHSAKPAVAGTATNDTAISEVRAAQIKAISAHALSVEHTPPDVALRYLRNGNTRFRSGRLRKDGQSTKDIQRLKKSQNPHSIVISCSDSRVPPEVLFDQKLGEIFTVRTAGQTLSREVVASVEYAVEHLGTRLILMLGHTSCGAVHATADAIKGQDHAYTKGALDDSENIAALIKDIRPRIEQSVQSSPSANLSNEGWANVRGAARELFQFSPYLQQSLSSGHVKVVGALYDLETGAVDFK